MSRFSTTKKVADTKNYMGEKAFKRSPKIELVNAVLSSFIQNTYYEKADARVERIGDLIEEVTKKDPEFVAKLAVFTRDEFNMRTSAHVIISELARAHRGDNLVSRAVKHLAIRPDDLVEIVAYIDKPIPNQIKKGVATAFENFDEYQLAKYRNEGKKVSLVDVVNLVHPKHTEAIAKLVNGELKNKDTWESKLSAAKGNSKDIWKQMLKDRKLGYMACLRNLRNIANTGDKETIHLAAEYIANPKAVANSRQFPFRFLSAYEAVKGTDGAGSAKSVIKFEKEADGVPELLQAITKAISYSVENLPLLEGRTAILSDNSGSMRGDGGGSSVLSANSRRTTADIANLFATMYWMRANNTFVGLFGDRLVTPTLDREKDLFENYGIVSRAGGTCGASTENGIYDFFEDALRNKTKVDRVVIFSDMQIGKNSWYGTSSSRSGGSFNSLFKKYKAFNPDVKVYSVDLRGYGTTVFSDGIYEFAGFSDKLFTIMEMADQDPQALVNKIKEVQI